MTPLKNDRFLRALRREPVDRTPVWLMRQAGRYLPEYRATRKQAGSFLGMAKNPEVACEVTLQPLRRFDLDAAILFSDILTVPDAMGLGLYFVEGEGPKFERTVRSAADAAKLGVPDMETELRYVMDAVRVIRRELDGKVPLIGFSGSPWTLACYMVEGGGSDNFSKVKSLALNDPAAMHRLLDVVSDAEDGALTRESGEPSRVLLDGNMDGGLPLWFRFTTAGFGQLGDSVWGTDVAFELYSDTGIFLSRANTLLRLDDLAPGTYVLKATGSGVHFIDISAPARGAPRRVDHTDRDRLLGGDGADVLIGGPGLDEMRGGDGDDLFVGEAIESIVNDDLRELAIAAAQRWLEARS